MEIKCLSKSGCKKCQRVWLARFFQKKKSVCKSVFTKVFAKCEGVEDVQGVLTLFCSGAAQVVCHALRVGELREQLEVEEEEVESGEGESTIVRHG